MRECNCGIAKQRKELSRRTFTANTQRRAVVVTASNRESCSRDASSDSEAEASPLAGRYIGHEGCQATESVRQVDLVCGTHTYSLAGYTLARAMGPGTRLCSDLFEVGGQLLRLELYPAGLDPERAKYVALFLTTPGCDAVQQQPPYMLYELEVLDKSSSRPQHITEARTAASGATHGSAAAVRAPQHPGVVAGFPKFIRASYLHRNSRRFLRDDTLSVRATVKVLTGWSSFPVAPGAPPQPLPAPAPQPQPAAMPYTQPYTTHTAHGGAAAPPYPHLTAPVGPPSPSPPPTPYYHRTSTSPPGPYSPHASAGGGGGGGGGAADASDLYLLYGPYRLQPSGQAAAWPGGGPWQRGQAWPAPWPALPGRPLLGGTGPPLLSPLPGPVAYT